MSPGAARRSGAASHDRPPALPRPSTLAGLRHRRSRLMETIQFIAANLDVIGQRMVEHIAIVLVAVGIATVTAVPGPARGEFPLR